MGRKSTDEVKTDEVEKGGRGGSPIYGLGIFGACAYFMQDAEEPLDYAIAFAKAVVWPAFMVYDGFTLLARWKGEG